MPSAPRHETPRDSDPSHGDPASVKEPASAREEEEIDIPFAPDADWVEEQRGAMQYAGVGLQFGLTLCLMALLGYWLDERLHTGPWLLIAGVAVGFGGGTLSLLKRFSS